MNILAYFGHPAQYLFLRETIKRLTVSGEHQVTILIKSKDVLEQLIAHDGFTYLNILPQQRGHSKLAILWSLFVRILRIIPTTRSIDAQLLIGSDASLAYVGLLFRIPCITITEDDYRIIRHLADLTYPVTQTILCPEICDVGSWGKKKTGYDGYMKLAYLHPNVFTYNPEIVRAYGFTIPYVIIRLVELTAHHDNGIGGINVGLLQQIISYVEQKGYRPCLTSEKKMEDSYTPYLLTINPTDMHHILAGATLLISDSQSMSVEAAVLGVASVRYSDFAGKISVLEELENQYQLTFGIPTTEPNRLLEKVNALLAMDNLSVVMKERQQRMLKDKIDVTAFLVWFLGNYPASRRILKSDPSITRNFHSS